MRESQTAHCPCGSERSLNLCCGPYLSGTAAAPTAEALMRSRYSAYATGNTTYLLESWDPRTRPAQLELDPAQRWLGLRILHIEKGAARDDDGVVEFVARCKLAGRGARLHEISRFRRTGGRWFYVDGARGATDSSRKP